MSKQQAILETLLGAAELSGNRMIAKSIRADLFNLTRRHQNDGYRRFVRAAAEPKRTQHKAA